MLLARLRGVQVLLGRLRIRGKLAVLVIIPLVSMGALAVPLVVDRVDSASRAAATAQSVRTAGRVGTLVRDLQQERLLSIGYLLDVVDRSELVRHSATVTDQTADLRDDLGPTISGQVAAALVGVRKLADLRTAVLARRASVNQVLSAFGAVDVDLIDALDLTDGADTATPAGRQVVALDAVLRTDEAISAAAALIVLVVGTKSPSASTQYVANMAALQVYLGQFRAYATPEQYALYWLVEDAATARTSGSFLTTGVLDPASAVAGLSLSTLFPAAASLSTLGQFIEKKLVTDVLADVTAQQRRAITTGYTLGGLVLLVLAAVVLLSALVARTVARPLIRLTVSADRVARLAEAELVRIADDETESAQPVRLDRVDVRTQDEIGDLARAFDRVQATAARLVERQAASRRNVAQMFGHVGRRTQNLVGRQIALIDRLEHQETDPTRLQHLYRLDHVSSRLRRNASSLVVLSGSAGADGHVAPLPLGDVVRLALGEIEDFTRVDVQVGVNLAVAPAIIGDLVLALAELMENGTAFSPPHSRVTLSAEIVEGGVRLTLVDHGIGMSADRLAEENARLTRRERLDLAPTEVLGLFVVGRLARRHGWRVTLSSTPGGGVTAELEIDDRSLVDPQVEPPVVAVARASVPPASAGGGPAAIPAQPGFNPALVSRASRSLASGQPWNAFALRPPGEAATAQPELTQRVPGASLGRSAPTVHRPPSRAGHQQTDPEEVRHLILQFEAGVARALQEVHPANRHQEGSPR
jgi:signal transduction histidine kinase